jgi:dipeptidyl aminopeptidase/acylaminoacyl peptidase
MKVSMNQSRVLFLLGFLMSASFGTFAQQAPSVPSRSDIPIADFVRQSEYGELRLSPDGKKIGAIAPVGTRKNLVVIDLEKRTRQIVTEFKDYDISSFEWVNNRRVMVRASDLRDTAARARFRGAWAIDIDGAVPVDFTSENPTGLRRTGGDSNEVIVQLTERSKEFVDVYRLDTRSKRKQLLSFDSPGRTTSWVLDKSNVPRVAFRLEEDWNARSVWYRSAEGSSWKKISQCDRSYLQECEVIWPIAFAGDEKTLYVASNVGRDKAAIFKYDPETQKLGELLFESQFIDLFPSNAQLLVRRSDREPMGLRYSADIDRVLWLDEGMNKLQRRLDSSIPGNVNSFAGTLLSGDGDDGVEAIDFDQRLVVYSYSATDPGTYFLYDLKTDKLEPIVKPRPWIKPESIPERRFVTIKARDGLEIPAWLTVPKGSSGKNLPTVVNIHGGPYLRAYTGRVSWGGYPDSAVFATRGYAVIEPEPRGGVGFGRRHFVSAVKQWGLAMQDDLTDVTKWLISEGIADKNRICLFGGSYGGYATLMGLAKEPDLYACGAASVAVTDMETFITLGYSDTNSDWKGAEVYFKRYVADLSKELEFARQNSPLRQVAKIKSPVQLVMGSDDRRVPLINGEKFRDAMAALGKPVEWHVYAGEGHGFLKVENRVDYYERALRFFDKHIGKKGQVEVKHPVPAS